MYFALSLKTRLSCSVSSTSERSPAQSKGLGPEKRRSKQGRDVDREQACGRLRLEGGYRPFNPAFAEKSRCICANHRGTHEILDSVFGIRISLAPKNVDCPTKIQQRERNMYRLSLIIPALIVLLVAPTAMSQDFKRGIFATSTEGTSAGFHGVRTRRFSATGAPITKKLKQAGITARTPVATSKVTRSTSVAPKCRSSTSSTAASAPQVAGATASRMVGSTP